MTDQRLEPLSALMDGELNHRLSSDLLDQIARDPELRASWERYHLIAQAMRGEVIDPRPRHLAAAVEEALQIEPVPIRRPSRRHRRSAPLAPFAGAALAAAAAFLAVFAVPNLFEGPAGPSLETLPRPLARWTPPAGVPERRWDLDRPDLVHKLDIFLVKHQEAAPAAGVKGMLPYGTLIGYEIGR